MLPVKLRARDVEEMRFTAANVEVEEPKGIIGRPTDVAMECRYDEPLLGRGTSYWDSAGEWEAGDMVGVVEVDADQRRFLPGMLGGNGILCGCRIVISRVHRDNDEK